MNIDAKSSNGEATVSVVGCLDTAAVSDFKRVVEGFPADVKKVTFEFSGLEFIASSALRVMVALGKRLSAVGGSVTVAGANDVVRDVFEVTGLVEVFTVL